jgi:hypothetical protein
MTPVADVAQSPAPEAAVADHITKEVEARLADLLNRVIDWLKFAEAKNTAAVGLASTGLGVIVTFLVAGPPLPDVAGAGMAIAAVALMVSLMLAVGSFLPSTNLEKFLLDEREQLGLEDHLLFYGHLARYEPRSLARAIAQHYLDTPGSQYAPSKLAVDYAGQVVTLARITVRKLELFKYSLLLFGFGVLIASAAMAFSAIVV